MTESKVKVEHKLTGRGVIFENEAVTRRIMEKYCHVNLKGDMTFSPFSLSPLSESDTPNENLREVVFDVDVYYDDGREYTIKRVQESDSLIYTESDYFEACDYDIYHTYAIDCVLERDIIYKPFEPVSYVTLINGERVLIEYRPKPMLLSYETVDIYSFDGKYATFSVTKDAIKREPFDYSYFVKS